MISQNNTELLTILIEKINDMEKHILQLKDEINTIKSNSLSQKIDSKTPLSIEIENRLKRIEISRANTKRICSKGGLFGFIHTSV